MVKAVKIRSEKLWQYLSNAGVLNGSKEEISKAKMDYRRKYKWEWSQNRKSLEREIRPFFSIKEYMDIKVKAFEVGLHPTQYLKELALVAIATKQIAPNKDILKKVLQKITMTLTSDNTNHLMEAEKLLLDYIQKY